MRIIIKYFFQPDQIYWVNYFFNCLCWFGMLFISSIYIMLIKNLHHFFNEIWLITELVEAINSATKIPRQLIRKKSLDGTVRLRNHKEVDGSTRKMIRCNHHLSLVVFFSPGPACGCKGHFLVGSIIRERQSSLFDCVDQKKRWFFPGITVLAAELNASGWQ